MLVETSERKYKLYEDGRTHPYDDEENPGMLVFHQDGDADQVKFVENSYELKDHEHTIEYYEP